MATVMRLGRIVSVLLCLAAIAGCASPNGEQGTSPSETDRLRADSDKAFEEIDGPGPNTVTATDRNEIVVKAPRIPANLPPPRKTREKPDWVPDGLSQRYPPSQYIVGLGSSRSARGEENKAMTAAIDRARAMVARQIRVTLKSEFNNSATLVTDASSKRVKIEEDRNAVSEQITTTVDMKLEGLQIADRWYDKREETYWALVVLNRATAAEAILDLMNAHMRQVRQDYDNGRRHREQGSVYETARDFNRARRQSYALLSYRSQLRAIAPAYAASADLTKTDAFLQTLWKDAAEAHDALRFGVLVFSDVAGEAKNPAQAEATLSRMLRKRGLTTIRLPPLPPDATYPKLRKGTADALRKWLGDQANCLVLAKLSTEETGSAILVSTRMHFYESFGEMVVLDLSDAQVLAAAGFDLSAETRRSNKTPARAAEASLAAAADLLCTRLEQELPAEISPD